MTRKPYPSDLNDDEWELIKPLIPSYKGITGNDRLLQKQAKKTDRILESNNDNEYIKYEYQQNFIEFRQNIEVLQSNLSEINNLDWLNKVNNKILSLHQKMNEIINTKDDRDLVTYQDFITQNRKIEEEILSSYLSLNKKTDDFLLILNNFVTYENLDDKILGLIQDNQVDLDEILKAAKLQSDAQLKPEKKAYEEIRDNCRKLQKKYNKLNQAYQDNFDKAENYVTLEELKQVQKDTFDNLARSINEFNSYIDQNKPQYELVYDREGSRKVLLEALEQAQERIILVCPWITYYGANHEERHGSKGNVIELCEQFLQRGGKLDIGWGHLKDVGKIEHLSMSRDEFLTIIKNSNKDWAYNQINKFIELENHYKNCNLKPLGTHEKFLVCDRSFAMVGSHNFLTSNCHSDERELGLRTDDKNIIEDLIDRFENGKSLERQIIPSIPDVLPEIYLPEEQAF